MPPEPACPGARTLQELQPHKRSGQCLPGRAQDTHAALDCTQELLCRHLAHTSYALLETSASRGPFAWRSSFTYSSLPSFTWRTPRSKQFEFRRNSGQ